MDDETLEKVAKALKIPAEAIKQFNDEAAFNIISNTFTDFKDNAVASAMNYYPSFNPIDKVVELFERMLKAEQEKNAMLEKLLTEKK